MEKSPHHPEQSNDDPDHLRPISINKQAGGRIKNFTNRTDFNPNHL